MITDHIRKASVAGQFYPGQPDILRETAMLYLKESHVTANPENVTAIVSPHAGIVYSGPTAGFAYARIAGKQPRRVILLGCSHRFMFPGASVYTEGSFETPLGNFPVDEGFARALASKLDSFGVDPHFHEHTLEVQLPFLGVAVGFVPIVPVLFGAHASEWHAYAGQILAQLTDESDLVIASTDLSHYLSESEANRIDRNSIAKVLTRDWRSFVSGVNDRSCAMCGSSAVSAAMTYASARGASSWKLLDYRTSAAASGDFSRVVGYAAVSMERAA